MDLTLKVIIILAYLAGFSWLNIAGIKPLYILCIILLFLLFFHKKSNKINVWLILFFVFTNIYDFILCTIFGTLTYFSIYYIIRELLTEILFVYLISYFQTISENEKIKIIYLMGKSISFYNIIILFIFFYIPSIKQLIVLQDKYGVRLCGFLSDNPNGYALIALIGVIIIFDEYIRYNRKVNLIFFLLNTVVIIFIQSRAALISLLFAIIFDFIFMPKLIRNKIFKTSILGLILFLITIFLNPFNIDIDFYKDVLNLSRFSENRYEASMTSFTVNEFQSERWLYINASIKTIDQYPLGIGSVAQVDFIKTIANQDKVSHNLFIGYVLTYGLVIGIIWIFLIFLLLLLSVKKMFASKIDTTSIFELTTKIIISIIIYLFFHIQDWIYIWIILAIHCSFIFQFKMKNDKI